MATTVPCLMRVKAAVFSFAAVVSVDSKMIMVANGLCMRARLCFSGCLHLLKFASHVQQHNC
eukprot:scaffold45270_cov37-Prasinocladus_malaysianus.AAC.2